MFRIMRAATVTVLLAVAVLSLMAGIGRIDTGEPVPRPAPFFPIPAISPAVADVGEPTRVQIPAIGVDEALTGVGLKADGAMQTPDFGSAGWYDLGPRPGAPGAAVLVAHVHGPDGPDVFYHLADLRPGHLIVVHHDGGASTFVVSSVEDAPKDRLPYNRIWADTDEPLLRLITCGGSPDRRSGRYPDNTIVYAHRL